MGVELGIGVDGVSVPVLFTEFVVVAGDPLAPKRTSQCRAKREGLANSVRVDDGGTRGR